MNLFAKSDTTVGNKIYASFAVKSNELCFVFTSAYNNRSADLVDHFQPHPGYKSEEANQFVIDQ